MSKNVGDNVKAVCFTSETVIWSCINEKVYFTSRIVLFFYHNGKQQRREAWPEKMEGGHFSLAGSGTNYIFCVILVDKSLRQFTKDVST